MLKRENHLENHLCEFCEFTSILFIIVIINYIKNLAVSQEQTFETNSMEIHDNVSQLLSVSKLNLGMIEDASPEVLEKIRSSGDLMREGKAFFHDKGSFFHRIILRPVYAVQNPPFALSDERGLNGLKQKTCFFEDH
jgi:hypothetical protein